MSRESKAVCNNCHIVGHFKKNCPKIKEVVPKIKEVVPEIKQIKEIRQILNETAIREFLNQDRIRYNLRCEIDVPEQRTCDFAISTNGSNITFEGYSCVAYGS